MPAPLASFLDPNNGTLVLAAGDQDTDRGLRIGYSHERWPRIKVTPQAGIFTGDGTGEPATPFAVTGTITLSALAGQTLIDNAGTDLDNLGTGPWAPARWWLTSGTQAQPITVAQPTVKLSSTFGTTLATSGSLANSEKAGTTFAAYAQDAAGCGIQITGVLGSAKQLTATGSDAVGVYGLGTISGAGTGIGTGGYFEGRRLVNTGKALGFEVRVTNLTATSGTYSSAGLSDTQGLWITSAGTGTASSGCGISLGAISGSQFRVGYAAVAGSIADSTFRDDSSSTVSLDVRGTHTYALDTSNFTPAASSRAVRLGNTHRFSAVNNAGTGVVDLFACDTSDRFQFFPGTPGNVVFSNGVNLVFSTGTTGSQIGTAGTQKLAFYGATPIIRPTATPAAATDLATVITLANDLRTKLLALGLVA